MPVLSRYCVATPALLRVTPFTAPVSAAVIVPAAKLLLASRATIVEAVFALVASLVSVAAAEPL